MTERVKMPGTGPLRLWVKAALKDEIVAIATEYNETISTIVRLALREYITKLGREDQYLVREGAGDAKYLPVQGSTMQIRITEELKARVASVAVKRNCSMSKIAREAFMDYCDKVESE